MRGAILLAAGTVAPPSQESDTSAPTSPGAGPNWGCGDYMQANHQMTTHCQSCKDFGAGAGCDACALGPTDCGTTSQATTRKQCYDDSGGLGIWCKPCMTGVRECGCGESSPGAGDAEPACSDTVWCEHFEGSTVVGGPTGWDLNVVTLASGATPNFWVINDNEGGVAPPGCGVGSNGDMTLHITSALFPTHGASYHACAGCETHHRAVSPSFSTVGFTDLSIGFDFIANGQVGSDFLSVWYDDGTGFTQLGGPLVSNMCAVQGAWTAFSSLLPASCEDNPGVRVAFQWDNNNDVLGSDPSAAINGVCVTGTPLTESPTASTPSPTASTPSPTSSTPSPTGTVTPSPTSSTPAPSSSTPSPTSPLQGKVCTDLIICTSFNEMQCRNIVPVRVQCEKTCWFNWGVDTTDDGLICTAAPTDAPSSSTPSPVATTIGAATPSPTASTPAPSSSTPSPTSPLQGKVCTDLINCRNFNGMQCRHIVPVRVQCEKTCWFTWGVDTTDDGLICTAAPTDAPSSSTPSPTSSTPAPIGTTLSGDPFTSYDGKRTQFWIPTGQETKLLTCGAYELSGRAMASGVKGDAQQWFDLFRLHVVGGEAVAVETRDAAALVQSGAGAGEGDDDVSVIPVELQQLSVQEQSRRASEATAGQTLTTLRVAVDKADVPTTGLFTAAARVNVTVTRDAARRIGRGYTEVLDVSVGGFAMQIHSALAGKLIGEERIKKMHLDLTFTSLNVTGCTGVLPEVWGLRPMSQQTAHFLNPQQ